MDQANKRVTFTGLVIIPDLGADVDDKFNGYIAYWPASQTAIVITDWEAGLDRATLDDMPAPTDTGACEIRRALYAPDMDAAFPLHRAVDGFPSIKAKVRAANVVLGIDAHLPNLIKGGGFESMPVDAIQGGDRSPGVWYAHSDWTISSTTPMLGARQAIVTFAAEGANLSQRLVSPIVKGKTYRLLFKARTASGTTNAGALRVRVINYHSNAESIGQTDIPALTTTGAWHYVEWVAPFSSDDLDLGILAINANKGTAAVAWIDEVYLWEVVPVASLLAFGHNWDGSPGPAVTGYRCSPSRTSVAADDYSALLAASPVAGSGPLRAEFAAGIFPIYRIAIAANAAFQYEIGELLLGEKWTWLSHPQQGMEPQAREYRRKDKDAISGARTSSLYFERRELKGRIRNAKAADVTIWDGPFRERHVKLKEPFALYWPGHLDTSRLMTCERLQIPYASAVRPDVDFEFLEAL